MPNKRDKEEEVIVHQTFATTFFEFKNIKLASNLKKQIQALNVKGIESKVAVEIKNNLDESNFDFFNREEKVIQDTVKYLSKSIKSSLNYLYKEKTEYSIYFPDSWYHICNENSTHEKHMHSNCSWCGIFYIDEGDIDKGGHTVFNHPIASNFFDNGSLIHRQGAIRIIPETGKLILFPSFLEHYQALYTGKKSRIVVGFNSSVYASDGENNEE